ncbi:MAG TPA: hypothetical protein VK586_06945 [Streptosporangiaceae bacterium]|nr:hypothetical protein [Streptosporangiaceae bacterium]
MILGDCGFEAGESWTVLVSHEWTVAALAGFMFGQAAACTADVERELLGCVPGGRFRQVISFACELARRPG